MLWILLSVSPDSILRRLVYEVPSSSLIWSACLRACSSSVLFMPGRAGASWAFPGSGNLTQLRVTDEAATIILIVQQRDFHRVVATFKP
jgi:hypothetical protein